MVLAGGAGEGDGVGVLVVVGVLGGADVGEARGDLEAALDRVVQRHREGDGVTLAGGGILDRQITRVIIL